MNEVVTGWRLPMSTNYCVVLYSHSLYFNRGDIDSLNCFPGSSVQKAVPGTFYSLTL